MSTTLIRWRSLAWVLPAMVLLLVFVYYPIVENLRLSLPVRDALLSGEIPNFNRSGPGSRSEQPTISGEAHRFVVVMRHRVRSFWQRRNLLAIVFQIPNHEPLAL